MDNPRVAVVIEDDQDIRELVGVILMQAGFEVHSAATGADGVEAVRVHAPVIVTLDLGLPDMDGFEVARQLRTFTDTYVIMLTGRADEMDTLLGLETGADDYLTKPFRPRELRARISAVLRRPRGDRAPSAEAPQQQLQTASIGHTGPDGSLDATASTEPIATPASTPLAAPSELGPQDINGLLLNDEDRTVKVDGKELDLTRTEFDLLHALVRGGAKVHSKSNLVHWIRGEAPDSESYISDADERTIEVHMTNLRRKMGDNPWEPRWIKTIRGVGYRLVR